MTIINGILFALVFLFVVRLYVTLEPFTKLVNGWFDGLERWYTKPRKVQFTKVAGVFGVIGFVLLFGFSLAVTVGINEWSAILVTCVFLIPAGAAIYATREREKRGELGVVLERIWSGEMGLEEIAQIKEALKAYYKKRYAPAEKPKPVPRWVEQLVAAAMLVIKPRRWFERIMIPRITAIPWFSGWFYYSLYHARFAKNRKLIDQVYDLVGRHPYRLHVKEVWIDDEFMTIEFTDSGGKAEMLAGEVAKKLEVTLELEEKTILVQEHEEQVRLFIPLAVIVK